MDKEDIQAVRYMAMIYGIVQGVGFRPYVYRKASKYNIKGYIKNLGSYVEIDIEGSKYNIKDFLLNLINNPPPLGKIEKIKIKKLDLLGYKDFKIKNSSKDTKSLKFISPDIATCDKCLEEMDNSNSKYYNYPFINCTECGPRYSIIKGLPYDRKNTTMDKFKMCSSCNEEYGEILNRRFHAQPISCNKCGPSLILTDSRGNKILTSNIIKRLVDYIKKGKIIAIKGIGGFHLCCDPSNEKTIDLLRNKKNRPYKPFAIMVRDLKSAKLISKINNVEEKILKSNRRPIVLLEKNIDYNLSDKVSPNNKYIGIMLPYTPIHHMFFNEGLDYLIMTSGNISNSPIKYKNEAALEDLKDIADYFLLNDRDINIPIDDTVTRVINNEEMTIRLARGYAPYGIKIDGNKEILALGGDLKGSFSFCQGGYGFISQYIGDLGDYDTFNTYEVVLNNLINLYNLKPLAIAYDLHHGYFSSKYGEKLDGLKFKIQHHHAHMVSAMGEHGLYNDTIGIIYDGSGMGYDGCIWGGEFFLGNRKNFKRVGHLKYVTIQGGDRAIKELYRLAISYLYELCIDFKNIRNKTFEELDLIIRAIKNNINTFITSSMGRLFDLVSYLLGICDVVTYEGQGAIDLENIINPITKDVYEYNIIDKDVFEIDYSMIIFDILEDIRLKVSPSIISAKFHNTVGKFTIEGARIIREKFHVNDVVLSGGVFQNKYLLEITYKGLVNKGFNVFYNKKIPINDNGISFGQMIIANSKLEGR